MYILITLCRIYPEIKGVITMGAPKGNQNAIGNKGGRPHTISDEQISIEAEELIKWAKLPDSIVLGVHYASRGYGYDDAWEWEHERKHLEFRKAKNYAKAAVGGRREAGGLTGAYDAGLVKSTMGNYDREHREFLKEQKNSSIESAQHVINILSRGKMDSKKGENGNS